MSPLFEQRVCCLLQIKRNFVYRIWGDILQEDAISDDMSSSWMYYQVSAPAGHETINLRVVMEVGYVELYAQRCPDTSPYYCAHHSLPNASYYSLTTANTDQSYLTVIRNDAASSLYIVGVRSLSMYAAYQISASFASSTLALQAGVAVMDHVRKGEVDYFSFFMGQSYSKLSIAITTVKTQSSLTKRVLTSI